MLLKVCDPDLSPVGVVQEYTSLQWLRQYNRPGEWSLALPYRPGALDLLTLDRLIVKGNEAGIIEDIQVGRDDTGVDMVTVTGRMLAGYLARRVLHDVNSLQALPGNVILYLVANNATGADRATPGLVVADPDEGAGDYISYQATGGNLLDEINSLAEAHDVGYRMVLAGGGLRFETYHGTDRSAGQSVNPRAIFAPEFGNLKSPTYTRSALDVRNYAYVRATHTVEYAVSKPGGGSETIKQTLDDKLEVGTAERLDRREVYVGLGDITKDEDGNTLTEAQRNAVMDAAGQSALIGQVNAFMGSIDPAGNLKYKEHYDLGDIVTVRSREWGVQVNARITEIKEIYEDDGMTLEPTLGYGAPSYIEQIRRLARG